ncbi:MULTISPECIES: L,D-transpeptidase family protein [unclassified Novosphingobium]|uniref:L,D-transpeptidase family protein n=1 Tax=unclassified Novosphingobium TaxID=2644732 RepID=UPI000EE9C215|nr:MULTISPECIES: L,D-transpeptidase family protein [unclassified Novosphingobium]HCF24745.1 L,D-transpeptidase [Novosphingobium sp.]HQV02045.1 L,D-transpeptidase family protein [Novosphingobium sp.]
MKFNSSYALLGLFGAAVIGGAALLLSQPNERATTLSPQADPALVPQPTAAPAPAAPPKDERFVIKRILPITGPIKYGEWHWDDKGVADGPIVVTVDLDARVLSVFKGGYEIGATAVLLGTSEKPTPLGEFPIKWKKADHYSSTYDGAPMPFTQNLTPDGVAIHGTKVEKGYASHGCIGVPDGFDKKLFGVTKVGDKVIITKGKTAKAGDSLI